MPQVCGESLGMQKELEVFQEAPSPLSFKKFQSMMNFEKTFKSNLMITMMTEAFINLGNNCNACSNLLHFVTERLNWEGIHRLIK